MNLNKYVYIHLGKELFKRVALSLPEIQKINPQQFPPNHSPAAFSGILKEGKGSGDIGASSSATAAASDGQSSSAGGSSSSSSKKKGRKGRK
jgi:hypothetical protein